MIVKHIFPSKFQFKAKQKSLIVRFTGLNLHRFEQN